MPQRGMRSPMTWRGIFLIALAIVLIVLLITA